MTTFRVISPQTTLRADPFRRLLEEVEKDDNASKREHAELRAQLDAMIAAAPVRQVLQHVAQGTDVVFELECGHLARYFKVTTDLRCYECAGLPSPTRYTQMEVSHG